MPTTTDLIVTLQVGLAGVLAGLIGWERYEAGRPAGVRTHALVAMAAACFALAGLGGFQPVGDRDVTRIAAQVASGVGFLGAGTILRTADRVQGLTTAASIWFVSALGVMVAGGLAWPAIGATILGLITLSVIERVEKGRWGRSRGR